MAVGRLYGRLKFSLYTAESRTRYFGRLEYYYGKRIRWNRENGNVLFQDTVDVVSTETLIYNIFSYTGP